MTDQQPIVLVVEDESDLADLYATWLKMEYSVRTAYGGEEALEQVDGEVDVMLLDRRMPIYSGDEVLEEVRERGIDCRVSMVSAVEPDLDIIEMGLDTYLTKPVTRDELEEAIEDLLIRNSYEEDVQNLFSLSTKKTILESERKGSTLADSEEYQKLCADIEELSDDLDTTKEPLDSHHLL